ncbi:MAG: O-antigen ligase family protein [Deltaproteobacteria bacterium]|nr:O-antigen ligase family protein [Deltaproteobacteria bacterium]
MKALLVGGIICAAATIYQYFVLIPSGTVEGLRAGSFSGGSVNHTAELLTICLPLCFFFFRQQLLRFWRVTAALSAILIINGITTTFSRSALLGLGAYFAVELYGFLKRSQALAGVGLVVITVTMFGLAAANVEQKTLDRRTERTTAMLNFDEAETYEGSAGSLEERLLHWEAAWLMFLDHPVLGIGAGGFGNEFGEDYQFRVDNKRLYSNKRSAHSTVLSILAEQGIVGLFVWIWFMAAWYFGFRRAFGRVEDLTISDRSYFLLIRGWWVLCVLFGVVNRTHYHKVFWVIAGLSFAWVLLMKDDHATSQKHKKSMGLAVVPANSTNY